MKSRISTAAMIQVILQSVHAFAGNFRHAQTYQIHQRSLILKIAEKVALIWSSTQQSAASTQTTPSVKDNYLHADTAI